MRTGAVSGASVPISVEGMSEPSGQFPLWLIFPSPLLVIWVSPCALPCTTHQAVPSEVEEIQAVHAEADILPVRGYGHHRLGVVPGHIMVDVP